MSLIDVEGFQMVQTHLNLLVDAVGNQPAALSTHSTRTPRHAHLSRLLYVFYGKQNDNMQHIRSVA